MPLPLKTSDTMSITDLPWKMRQSQLRPSTQSHGTSVARYSTASPPELAWPKLATRPWKKRLPVPRSASTATGFPTSASSFTSASSDFRRSRNS